MFLIDTHEHAGTEASVAVFAMHPDTSEPVSAITIVPAENGTEATVTNLRNADESYTTALPRPSQDDAIAAAASLE